MKKTLNLGIKTTSLLFSSLLVITSNASALINYEGEVIKWVVPFSAGGGADVLARFYAPLLSENLPGKPDVEVINMPGAGSTKGANWFSSESPIDGKVIFFYIWIYPVSIFT